MNVKSDSLGLSYLINAYQTRGHEIANLDPLNINSQRSDGNGKFNRSGSGSDNPMELDYKFHGFNENDLDRKLNLLGTASGGNTGFLEVCMYVCMLYV